MGTVATHGTWLVFAKAIWRFAGRYRRAFISWNVLLFVVNFSQFANPYFLGKIVDFLTKYRTGDSLLSLYLYILAGVLVVAVAALVRLHGKKELWKIDMHIVYNAKTSGFEELMKFSIAWHGKMNAGNKVKKIETGVEGLSDTVKITAQSFYTLLTGVVGSLILFTQIGFSYTLFVTVYLVILYSIYAYFLRRTKILINQLNEAKERASGTYYEGVSNVLAVKSLGAAASIKGSVFDREKEARDIDIQRIKLINAKWQAMQVVGAIFGGVLLFFLTRDVLSGVLTVGAVLTFAAYFGSLHGAVSESTNYLDKYVENRNAVARMLPIFMRKKKGGGDRLLGKNWKQIVIRDASFCYKKGKEEFKIENVSVEIARGEKIGIVGKSGSGKSTLAKILLGLYTLKSGEYLIDGVPFEQFDSDSVLKRFSIVLQEPELFNYTLRENITMLKKASESMIVKAIKIAQLEPVIQKLPKGLDTLIGEKGYQLSGGERQRIGIARAVVMRPDLLILDEATSNLDVVTEQKVVEALIEEFEDKTLLVIAHRLSTVRRTDKLYVFDNGKTVQSGTFNTLAVAENSVFAKMYKTQLE